MEDYIHYLRAMIGHSKALSVGLTALLINEKQEVLLEKRSDNGLYCFPGGGLDYEEQVLAGVRRELREETGLDVNSWSLFMKLIKGKIARNISRDELQHRIRDFLPGFCRLHIDNHYTRIIGC